MDLNDEDAEEVREPTKKKFPINLMISEGNKYLRLLKFEKAIFFFGEVLERNPKNINSLLGRAKCFMRLARYKEAWFDFQQVIKINPKCTEAIYLKGVTEYLSGKFEKSFHTYWEGHKLRPSCDNLRLGYQMCEKAIKNNLKQGKLGEEDVASIQQLSLRDQSLEEKSSQINTYDNRGLFSADLKLMEDLSNDKNLTSIHPLCKDLFDYLSARRKFWKMQDPPRKRRKLNRMKKKSKFSDSLLVDQLIHLLSVCKIALEEGITEICLANGNEILLKLSSESSEAFPEKYEIEAEALNYLGLASMVKGEPSSALKHYEKQLEIGRNNKMSYVEGRALRNIGEILLQNNKYDKALKCFQESLQFADSEEQKVTILYRVSDCSVHTANLENAQNTAQTCLEYATKNQNKRFEFDVLLLLAEIAVKGKDMEVAEKYYKDALKTAVENNDNRQKDLENLFDYFTQVVTKESYSNERIKIMELTDDMKHMQMLGSKHYETQLGIGSKSRFANAEGRAQRDIGEVLLRNNKYEKALMRFQQSLQFANSGEEIFTLLYKISDCYVHIDDLENAQNMAQMCLEYANKSQNRRFEFDVLLLLAETAVKGKDMEIAGRFYQDALKIAVENNDDRQKDLESLLEMFEEDTNKESHSNDRIKIIKLTDDMKCIEMSPLKHYEKQPETTSNNKVAEVQGTAQKYIGEIFFQNNKYEKALMRFQQSLQFANSGEEVFTLLYKISDCYVHIDDLENAQYAAQMCLEYAVKSQNRRFEFDVLLLLAEIAVKDKDMEVAESYYKEALKTATENNDSRQEDIKSLLEMFDEVVSKESYSKEKIKIIKLTDDMKHIEKDALKLYEKQSDIGSNNKLDDVKGRAQKYIGEVLLQNNKYKNALMCFQQSLQCTNAEEAKAELHYKMSDCYVHINDLENARNAAQICLEYAIKFQNKRFEFHALLLLAEAAVKGKNMEVAENYYKEALKIAVECDDNRQKDLENLLTVLGGVIGKKSYSNERIKIIKITDDIKYG